MLPPAARTAAGYRRYADIHVQSALAYRALAAGAGPVEAKTVMRTAHQAPVGDLLALLDSLHARLDRQRREVDDTQQAVAAISAEPMHDPRPADAMTVSELADALGIRASTLRHWDAEGLLVPADPVLVGDGFIPPKTFATPASSTSSAKPGTVSARFNTCCLSCGRPGGTTKLALPCCGAGHKSPHDHAPCFEVQPRSRISSLT